MKRCFALFICAVMLLSVLPIAAAKAETVGEQPDRIFDALDGPELPEHERPYIERTHRPENDALYEAFREAMAVPQEERWFDPDIPEIGGIVTDDDYIEGEKGITNGKLYINATNFPDENFRYVVYSTIYRANDSYFTTAELNEVTYIYAAGAEIASIKGIEYFPNLMMFDCGRGYDDEVGVINYITDLDVSKNTKLEYLYCDGNPLTSLDVSKNIELRELICSSTQLKSLNVANCPDLYYLDCSDNALTSLDVSKNTKLETLWCYYNQLKSLNVTKLPDLVIFDCGGNALTSLDVSKNPKLQSFYCESNKLTSINVTKNTALTYFGCADNPIGTLDVRKNTKLVYLNCWGNNLMTLDVTKNTALTELYCSNNDLRTLDVSKNTELQILNCCKNGLKQLDVSKNTKLNDLYCYLNRLTSLDVSHNPELVNLYCFRNHLTSLDVTHNPNIEILTCGNNRIASLDVSKIPALIKLYCNKMPLTSLDVSKNTALEELYCYYDELTSLDVSNNENLAVLYCYNNHLKALDVSNNPYLWDLVCCENEITALDLSYNDDMDLYINYQSRILKASDLTQSGDNYVFDLHKLGLTDEELEERVWIWDEGDYDETTGKITFPKDNATVTYAYDTQQNEVLLVKLALSYTGDAEIVLNDPDYVFYKGTTPYMVYRDGNLEPIFQVLDSNGEEIGVAFYTYEYLNNVKPGTATIKVTFKGTGEVLTKIFKIYMPETTATSVENTGDGIKITWRSVQDAKGYVIYRRAWNLQSSGWTTFERWNNTTATTWTDTKVYAGTRYQYGVKAYYTNAMDNYNLGLVGPLKTTVRITSRTLKSLTAGSKQFTAKWDPSGVFTGYQLQYATNSAFTAGLKTVTIDNKKVASQTVTGLTSGTTYYVRVRSYHKFEGMTYYGAWSTVLSCTVK